MKEPVITNSFVDVEQDNPSNILLILKLNYVFVSICEVFFTR